MHEWLTQWRSLDTFQDCKSSSGKAPSMRRRDLVVAVLAGCAALPAADWLTDGYDARRTGWQRDEKILSKSTVSGMKPLWKLQLDNHVRELHALFPPLIIGGLSIGGTTREVAIVSNI